MDEFIEVSENKIKESIKEEMSKLEQGHQLAINSFNWLKKCQEIGEEYNLIDNEIHGLKIEVILVLMGLSNLDNLRNFIDDEIGGTGWEKIYDSIIESILEPVGDLMNRIESYSIINPTYFYFEDIYSLDLQTLLKNSKLSGTRALKDSELTMKYYDCVLEPTFLNAFNILRIGFVWEEKELNKGTGTQALSLILLSNKELMEMQVAYVVDSIFESCKDMPNVGYGTSDLMRFKDGTGSFILLDHPSGHDIGISKDENIGVTVDFQITYEDFLKCKEKYCI